MNGKGEYKIEGKYSFNGHFNNDDIEGEGFCVWENGKKFKVKLTKKSLFWKGEWLDQGFI